MSEEFIEFPSRIKSCSVVLERLDKTLLSQYLQKYDPTRLKTVEKRRKISNKFSKSLKENKRKLKKSVKMNIIKKRKRKIKPLSSSDDESSNEIREIFDKKTKDDDSLVIIKQDKILHENNNFIHLPESNNSESDNEVEVIQEITKSCNLQENLKMINSDELNGDFREENEDDRITVIFEESPEKKEVFEMDEKETDKFKNSAIKNSGIEYVGEIIAEKSVSDELITDYYLKRLCSLVKRLHELFRIVGQLQKDESQNGSFNFSAVLRVQKAAFLKEIKVSQKPVIECYGKLLTLFKNSNDSVISKISEHAHLSLEDVSNIISRCLILGKFHKMEKNETQPKTLKIVRESTKKRSTGKKVSKGSQKTSQSYSFLPSETFSCQYEIIPTADESVDTWVIPTGKQVVNHIQKPLDHGFGSFFPTYNNFYIQKQNIWAQQKNQNQVYYPPHKVPSQNHFRYPSVVPDSLKCNTQLPQITLYPQNIPIMAPNFSIAPQCRCNPQFPAQEIPAHPSHVHHFYIPSFVHQKTASEQFSLSNFSAANQNISTAVLQHWNNSLRGSVVLPSNIQDVQKLAQYPVGDDRVRFSKENPRGEEVLGKQSFNEIKDSVQEVVDFTTPGLPVGNYQIQRSSAGGESEGSEKSSSFSEIEGSHGVSKEGSNIRTYVCAQSDCKMPGIRICRGCQSIIYCSETCQLKHWVLQHKTECYQLRELRRA